MINTKEKWFIFKLLCTINCDLIGENAWITLSSFGHICDHTGWEFAN